MSLITIVQGVLIIGGSIALSILGLTFVHRLVPVSVRCQQNDVAGFIYAVVGVMYAILLAYVTIVVWEQFNTTSETVDAEAVELQNMYHGIDQFPDPERSNAQNMISTYVQTTMEQEWPMLASGESSPTADQLAHDLRGAIDQLQVNTPKDRVMFDHVMTAYESFLQQRDQRLFDSRVGVHPILWVMLIGGALLTIGFTYFFGMENALSHGIMVVALTLVIAGLLFMVQQVNYPFSGDVHVSDEAFRQALATFTG